MWRQVQTSSSKGRSKFQSRLIIFGVSLNWAKVKMRNWVKVLYEKSQGHKIICFLPEHLRLKLIFINILHSIKKKAFDIINKEIISTGNLIIIVWFGDFAVLLPSAERIHIWYRQFCWRDIKHILMLYRVTVWSSNAITSPWTARTLPWYDKTSFVNI